MSEFLIELVDPFLNANVNQGLHLLHVGKTVLQSVNAVVVVDGRIEINLQVPQHAFEKPRASYAIAC